MRSRRASTRSRALAVLFATLAVAGVLLLLKAAPGTDEAGDLAPSDHGGFPPSGVAAAPGGAPSIHDAEALLGESPAPMVLDWQGRSVSIEPLGRENVECGLEEAAALKLDAYRDQGRSLLWSGYLDLMGKTWACIASSGPEAELCFVSEEGGCSISSFRIIAAEGE